MDIEEAASILEINTDATNEELDAAYKKFASIYHPDKGGNSDDMAQLNKARDALQEHLSVQNLPSVIKQFELTVKEMNVVAREQRALEKRAEKTEREIFSTATNKLKSYKQTAIILAAVSAAGIFLGKEIPKELTSAFTNISDEKLVEVSSPVKTDLVNSAIVKLSSNKDVKDTEETIELTTKEKSALKKYEEDEYAYIRYQKNLLRIEDRKERSKIYTSMWYMMTFGVGIYAGMGAWWLNRRIQRIEEKIEELMEDLSIKSQYAHILIDLFEGSIEKTWSLRDLQNAIIENGQNCERIRPILRAVGEKKIAQLLITKGLESSALNVFHGNYENKYEEAYLFS